MALCQACHRTNDKCPAGIVTLTGTLAQPHRAELIHLARHQEEAEKPEHPLNRITSIEEAADRFIINTTDVHLPLRIGQALKQTYKGALKLHYDEGSYFVRGDWSSDG
jgi:hypothetical protein